MLTADINTFSLLLNDYLIQFNNSHLKFPSQVLTKVLSEFWKKKKKSNADMVSSIAHLPGKSKFLINIENYYVCK